MRTHSHPGINKHTFKISVMTKAVLLGFVVTAATSVNVHAQNSGSPFTFSGSLEAGAEYNSNVSVSELESASGESDMAGALDAALDMNWKPAERVTVDAGYSFTSRQYDDFDAFDLDMHLLYGDVSYELDLFTVGANYYFADAQLGGDDFLTLKQRSLYAGKLFDERWYLRAALNFSDKDFDGFGARDASNEGLSLDAFWFFNQGMSTLVAGYAYEDEDTRADQFAYKADTLRTRFTHRFLWNGRESSLQLGGRAQFRDYQGITPDIGIARDDKQYVLDASVEVNLMPWLAVTGKVERGDYRSRLASADYTENRIKAGLKVSF
jgi:hypothetical protein